MTTGSLALRADDADDGSVYVPPAHVRGPSPVPPIGAGRRSTSATAPATSPPMPPGGSTTMGDASFDLAYGAFYPGPPTAAPDPTPVSAHGRSAPVRQALFTPPGSPATTLGPGRPTTNGDRLAVIRQRNALTALRGEDPPSSPRRGTPLLRVSPSAAPLRLVAPAPTHPHPAPPDAELDGPDPDVDDSFAASASAGALPLVARVNQLERQLTDTQAQLGALTLQLSLQLETQVRMSTQLQRLEAHAGIPPSYPPNPGPGPAPPISAPYAGPPASAPPTGPRHQPPTLLPTLSQIPPTPISPPPGPFFPAPTPPAILASHIPDRARLSPLAPLRGDKRHSWGPGAPGPDRPLSRRARRELAAQQHQDEDDRPHSRGGATSPHPLARWEMAGLVPELLKAIQAYGLGPPTRVQQRALPALLAGKDALVQAPPTQERMATYIVLCLEKVLLSRLEGGSWTLVVCTTADQASQAARLATGLGRGVGVDPCLLSTALPDALPELIITTPARVGLLAMLSPPRLCVLDEVDQLVARGLADGVVSLLRAWERQLALFSNTVPQDVLALTRTLRMKDLVRVLVRRDHLDPPSPPPQMRGRASTPLRKEYYLYVPSSGEGGGVRLQAKAEAVAELVAALEDTRIIVLAAEAHLEQVTAVLRTRGTLPSTLSRSHPINTRAAALALARQGRTSVLVLSDPTLLDPHGWGPKPFVSIWFDLPRSGEEVASKLSLLPHVVGAIMVVSSASGPRGDVEILRTLEAQLGVRYAELPPDPRGVFALAR